jgi:hypothetical protein
LRRRELVLGAGGGPLVSVRNRKRIAVGVFALTADEATPRHDLSELGTPRYKRLPGRSNIFGTEVDLWRTLAHWEVPL